MPTHRSLRLGALVLLGLFAGTYALQAQRTPPKTTRTFDEKSGMVEMKMSMMGMEPTMTLYFDDYGAKTATIVRMDMMGQTSVQHTVTVGNVTTQWSEQTMEGTRTKGKKTGQLTEYMQMDEKRRRRLNYTELGEKELLGKPATGFSVDTAGVTMRIWQWRNIPLYMEAETQGQTVVFEATRVEVPSDVSASVFEVPSTVTIEDATPTPPRRRPRR